MTEQSNLLAKYAQENKDLRQRLKQAEREIALYRTKALTWSDDLWRLARERFNPEAEKLLAHVDLHLASQQPIPSIIHPPFLHSRELLRWIRAQTNRDRHKHEEDLFFQGLHVSQALLMLGAAPAWPQASVVYQAAFEVNVQLWIDQTNEEEAEEHDDGH